jgi:3-methyladenine DNA glycosylase AlkD
VQLPEILKRLQRAGSAKMRKVYLLHGAKEPIHGVAHKDLHVLHREIGTDHPLARELWRTGVHEARLLAMCVADPQAMAQKDLEEWLGDVDNRELFFEFGRLAAKSPAGRACAERWIESSNEWVAASGWAVVSQLCTDQALPDAWFAQYLPVLEQRIHASPNFTRYAMNAAVIAIACRPALHAAGAAAAERIGQVDVDHGPTGCQTPFAPDYIEKLMAHARRAAGRSGARAKAGKVAKPAGKARARSAAGKAATRSRAPAKTGSARRSAVAARASKPSGRRAAAGSRARAR